MSRGSQGITCDFDDRLPGQRGYRAQTGFGRRGSIDGQPQSGHDPGYRASGTCVWVNPSPQQLFTPYYRDLQRLRATAPTGTFGAETRLDSHEWHDGTTTNAIACTLTIAGCQIDFTRPTSSIAGSANLPTNAQIMQSLRIIPIYQLVATQRVVVNHIPHRGTRPNRRIQASAGSGDLDIFPFYSMPSQTVLDARLLHECAHNFQTPAWKNTPESVAQWDMARNLDVIAPSRYATTNTQEDFAEFVMLYNMALDTNCEREMRRIYPNRCWLMDRYRIAGLARPATNN